MTVKVQVDLREFKDFTKKVPGVMDGLVKESFTRGAAKMRKEFHRTITRRRWAPLQETEKYKSKYSRPLQVLKAMVRYRVTGGRKRITATIGIFPGKAGRSKLNNAQFRRRYGVTVARFGKLMTYGGNLRIRPEDTIRMAKQGFYVSKRTKAIKFPKRNWYGTTKWRRPGVILPYIEKDLNDRVSRRIQNGNFYKRLPRQVRTNR